MTVLQALEHVRVEARAAYERGGPVSQVTVETSNGSTVAFDIANDAHGLHLVATLVALTTAWLSGDVRWVIHAAEAWLVELSFDGLSREEAEEKAKGVSASTHPDRVTAITTCAVDPDLSISGKVVGALGVDIVRSEDHMGVAWERRDAVIGEQGGRVSTALFTAVTQGRQLAAKNPPPVEIENPLSMWATAMVGFPGVVGVRVTECDD